jgi:M-phase inducer tyrosine phosphatase
LQTLAWAINPSFVDRHYLNPMSDIDPPSFDDYSRKYRRITRDTFCSLFDNHPNFKKLVVVDCRTKGEYDGGHIKGAMRRHPFENGFETLYSEIYDPTTLIIFHCEFSAYRAPASIVRFTEQHAQSGRDPASLHVFVLDGGYSEFWPERPEYCDGGYVTEMSLFRSSWY